METMIETDSIKIRLFSSPNALDIWLRLLPFLRYLADACSVSAVFIALVCLKPGSFPDHYRIVPVLSLLIHAFVYGWINTYSAASQQSFFKGALQISTGWITSVLAFATKTTSTYSRDVLSRVGRHIL